MQIPVLVEPVAGNGYVARAGSPFDWSAEGATPEEAVAKLRAEAGRRFTAGTQVVTIDVPPQTDTLAQLRAKGAVIEPFPPGVNPWLQIAGTWKDDPMIDEFRKAVEEYRESIDNDPNIP